MIILGIDPGTATTGYGVIKIQNPKSPPSSRFAGLRRASKTQNNLRCLAYGSIETDKSLPMAQRLKKLYNELNKLIKKHGPSVMAVENVYFFKNLKTAMPVSQAKGVILLTAAKQNLAVYEFTPLQVKMTVAGYGRAEKTQVQKMIKLLLNLKDIPKPDDAADALAVALCYQRAIDASINSASTLSGVE